MLNVQIVPAHFEVAYLQYLAETYPAILDIISSGSYSVIPYANDNFDIYGTGFQAYLSGSGFWNGSGSTSSWLRTVSENFSGYQTGVIYSNSGGLVLSLSNFRYDISGAVSLRTLVSASTGNVLNSGITTTGYISRTGVTTGTVITPIDNAFVSGNNLAASGGYFLGNNVFYCTGYSGYGTALFYPGLYLPGTGVYDLNGFVSYVPPGSSTAELYEGAIEFRFARKNAYTSGAGYLNQSSTGYYSREALYSWGITAQYSVILARWQGEGQLKMAYTPVAYAAEPSIYGHTVSQTDFQDDIYYTLSCVFSNLQSGSGSATMYVNGVKEATGLFSNPFFHSTDATRLSFGRNAVAYAPFYGTIDEIRVWDYPRTSGEIAANWDKTVSPSTGGLAVLFRL